MPSVSVDVARRPDPAAVGDPRARGADYDQAPHVAGLGVEITQCRHGRRFLLPTHVPRDDDKSRALHSTLAEQHAAMSAAGFTAVSTVIDDPLMYLCCARRPA